MRDKEAPGQAPRRERDEWRHHGDGHDFCADEEEKRGTDRGLSQGWRAECNDSARITLDEIARRYV
jgi:hypothetical protein